MTDKTTSDRKAEIERPRLQEKRVSPRADATSARPPTLRERQDIALVEEIESGNIAADDIDRVRRSAEAAEAFAAKVLGRRRRVT